VIAEVARRAGTLAALAATMSASALVACDAQPARQTVETPFPVVEVPADSGHTLALLLTGDGGWARGDRALAEVLVRGGVSVLALDSRAYLRAARRTPELAARDATAILERYAERWHRDRLVLVGYSRGADLAPFIVSRWPAALRERLALLALVGFADHANFEFHWQDLLHDSRRASDLPTRPELEKLRGTRVLCVYGAEEGDSVCPSLEPSVARVARIPGGHVLDASTGAAAGRLVVDALR
jgi:type IV secretory pathway VirJ component